MTAQLTLYDQVAAAFNAGDYPAVDNLMAPVLATGGGEIRLLDLLAATRMKQRRFEEAGQLYSAIASALQENATAALNAATAYYNGGNLPLAQQWAVRAAELDDNLAEAHYIAAAATNGAFDAIDLQAAQNHLQRATTLRPDWFHAHCQYGRWLMSSGKEVLAEAAFRRAIELDPKAWSPHEELAGILLEMGKVEEAIVEYERALELNPQATRSRLESENLRTRRASRDRLARSPRSVREFDDLDKLFEKYILTEFANAKPLINFHTPVLTLGSCFASNIAKALQTFGVPARSVDYEEDINNTFANLRFFEWLLDRNAHGTEAYAEKLGEEKRIDFLQRVKIARVAIMSLGVAPAFFDRETGEFALTFGTHFIGTLAATKYQFRTTTVEENVRNVKRIIEILRKLNPKVPVVITVSPVPLRATYERPSAIVADCVSKSILRVAAHELTQAGIEDLWYWPSFEMVKWIATCTPPTFGQEDDNPTHVSQELIRKVMFAFVRVFGEAEVADRAAAALSIPA